MPEPIMIGSARVDLIVEMEFPEGPPADLLTELPADAVSANLSWFAPHYYEADTERMISSVNIWVVRLDGQTVVIDTGNGNGKSRPQFSVVDNLDTPFLEQLAAIGVAPEQVDAVICTHLHLDHVGWNTRADGDSWVPTFPNATYYFPQLDFDHWDLDSGPGRNDPINGGVFEDSVKPIIDAGLARLLVAPFAVSAGISIEPAPGHSPGHTVVEVTSEGATGIFFGDLMHTPLQVLYPSSNSIFCMDAVAAATSRSRILEAAADGDHILFSAHFPGEQAGRVAREGSAFSWHPVA